ncbi:DUF1799 domain-containing protein [Nitrosomonas oligotropha]|uniref:DUF1799 domain-containing protein n=1 Tax=Nitrosomonas oligotropha TaxID=42354 RepID=UPI003B8359EB
MEDSEAEQEDEYFAVWPENWKTLQIFLSLGKCFPRDYLSGQFHTIARSDIESTLTMHNIRPTKRRTLLDHLIAMESAALEMLNRK